MANTTDSRESSEHSGKSKMEMTIPQIMADNNHRARFQRMCEDRGAGDLYDCFASGKAKPIEFSQMESHLDHYNEAMEKARDAKVDMSADLVEQATERSAGLKTVAKLAGADKVREALGRALEDLAIGDETRLSEIHEKLKSAGEKTKEHAKVESKIKEVCSRHDVDSSDIKKALEIKDKGKRRAAIRKTVRKKMGGARKAFHYVTRGLFHFRKTGTLDKSEDFQAVVRELDEHLEAVSEVLALSVEQNPDVLRAVNDSWKESANKPPAKKDGKDGKDDKKKDPKKKSDGESDKDEEVDDGDEPKDRRKKKKKGRKEKSGRSGSEEGSRDGDSGSESTPPATPSGGGSETTTITSASPAEESSGADGSTSETSEEVREPNAEFKETLRGYIEWLTQPRPPRDGKNETATPNPIDPRKLKQLKDMIDEGKFDELMQIIENETWKSIQIQLLPDGSEDKRIADRIERARQIMREAGVLSGEVAMPLSRWDSAVETTPTTPTSPASSASSGGVRSGREKPRGESQTPETSEVLIESLIDELEANGHITTDKKDRYKELFEEALGSDKKFHERRNARLEIAELLLADLKKYPDGSGDADQQHVHDQLQGMVDALNSATRNAFKDDFEFVQKDSTGRYLHLLGEVEKKMEGSDISVDYDQITQLIEGGDPKKALLNLQNVIGANEKGYDFSDHKYVKATIKRMWEIFDADNGGGQDGGKKKLSPAKLGKMKSTPLAELAAQFADDPRLQSALADTAASREATLGRMHKGDSKSASRGPIMAGGDRSSSPDTAPDYPDDEEVVSQERIDFGTKARDLFKFLKEDNSQGVSEVEQVTQLLRDDKYRQVVKFFSNKKIHRRHQRNEGYIQELEQGIKELKRLAKELDKQEKQAARAKKKEKPSTDATSKVDAESEKEKVAETDPLAGKSEAEIKADLGSIFKQMESDGFISGFGILIHQLRFNQLSQAWDGLLKKRKAYQGNDEAGFDKVLADIQVRLQKINQDKSVDFSLDLSKAGGSEPTADSTSAEPEAESEPQERVISEEEEAASELIDEQIQLLIGKKVLSETDASRFWAALGTGKETEAFGIIRKKAEDNEAIEISDEIGNLIEEIIEIRENESESS